MFNNLEIGKVYWIKHNEIRNRCEGQVSKSTSNKLEVSLVQVSSYDKKLSAYFCIPLGHYVLYGISVKDILDVALVENPFKDAQEDV